MDRSKLKTYAPKARRDFIRAVTDRAAVHGLTEGKVEPVAEKGDVAIIGGKAYPLSVVAKRRALEDRIKRQGFGQTMEAMAYTWFNRLVAIRFMELHGYLDHGYRVLSASPSGNGQPPKFPSPTGRGQGEGGLPEILLHAEHVDLPGLDKNKVIELKLDATKENELYRILLIAQCNALHSAMPFLFERIDDETELLMPGNLLHSDSLIRQLVNEIDEADWQEVEIIGWLYQFYISEKKDEVIGSVVKSEDLPAATQLFTPNWIVKYLVQNSLGQRWLATYPNSPLQQQMEYYIEPAEQTPEVQAQLKATTPESLNPEEITLLDPACGSGHILVEAYDIFKEIYQERGYRAKDIPRLILEKNLFGLEIDDRAAQLAAFALMMKARADDRRIFDLGLQPHVVAIQESKGLDAKEITDALNTPILAEKVPPSEHLFEEIADEKSPLLSRRNLSIQGSIPHAAIAHLLNLFESGKAFGALIQVPSPLAAILPGIVRRIEDVIAHGGMLEKAAAGRLKPLVRQAVHLSQHYCCVVTNPPYCGSRYMNRELSNVGRSNFKAGCADMFAMFIQRSIPLVEPHGHLGIVCPFVWMFIATYERLRQLLLSHGTFQSMVRLE